MAMIKVESLSKIYKKTIPQFWLKSLIFPKYERFLAVNSISFEIEKKEIFGLLGPNGAGKTTTIQMLCGIEYPTSGTIYIDGMELQSNYKKICEKFNVLFSDKLLYNRLTAYDNLLFFANLYSIEDPESRVDELFKMIELEKWKDQYVEFFSLGMRMKLAIARALLNNPELLYLDEPTLGLDVRNAEFVRELLRKLDCTILLTTHYLNEAIMLCDRIGILREGKLVHIGAPEELKKRNLSQRVFLINTNDNETVQEILAENPLIDEIVKKNKKLEVYLKSCDDYFDILREIQGFKLFEFQELKTGLEGLFFDVEDELTRMN